MAKVVNCLHPRASLVRAWIEGLPVILAQCDVCGAVGSVHPDDEPSTDGLDVFALPEVDMDMLGRRGKEVDAEVQRLARLLMPNNPDMAQALADLRAEYKAGSARREGA